MKLLKRANLSASSSPRQTVTDPRLRALLEISKTPSRLLGDVQKSILKPGNNERPTDVLHPSEVAHNDWCRRAAYYQLVGIQPKAEAQPLHWRMQMIFDEGKEIHRKWQNRIWAIGRLSGIFYCYQCRYAWWDNSPDQCQRCHADRVFLTYHEVPLVNQPLRIAGHADGQDGDDAVIEIKSIGLGTLAFEAPDLLKAHTYHLNINARVREFIDYDGLWDSIHMPFPSHIRQGHLYSFLGAPTDEIFIYECKWNQRVKEFVVKYREERIAGLLDDCRLIRRALEEHKPPSCRQDGCSECQLYEEELDQQTKPRRILTRRAPTHPTPTTTDGRRLQRSVQPLRQPGEDQGLRRAWSERTQRT